MSNPVSAAKTVAIIVAHPDDETLWAGGTILNNPAWDCFVLCLCRGSDADRAPRFFRALEALHATGIMADLDDSPEQLPLDPDLLEQTILDLLPDQYYDLVITHSLNGEYSFHRRHGETGKAVIKLWTDMKIRCAEIWAFAYEDGDKNYLPQPIRQATILPLSDAVWLQKYHIITRYYGFEPDSWEALTTPRREAFWKFSNPKAAELWTALATQP